MLASLGIGYIAQRHFDGLHDAICFGQNLDDLLVMADVVEGEAGPLRSFTHFWAGQYPPMGKAHTTSRTASKYWPSVPLPLM